ncbi:hypothetical protein GCM10023215_57890 [Pseudonocardia yuanmonensis]|uniref:Uncharacterized protein n=1 Tax=Pseudonocardia yuanmonensis TaxID=1095914 RepID=A0ABP8XMB9_9PSEU
MTLATIPIRSHDRGSGPAARGEQSGVGRTDRTIEGRAGADGAGQWIICRAVGDPFPIAGTSGGAERRVGRTRTRRRPGGEGTRTAAVALRFDRHPHLARPSS